MASLFLFHNGAMNAQRGLAPLPEETTGDNSVAFLFNYTLCLKSPRACPPSDEHRGLSDARKSREGGACCHRVWVLMATGMRSLPSAVIFRRGRGLPFGTPAFGLNESNVNVRDQLGYSMQGLLFQ